MHLKNFSMIKNPSGWVLSPAYDLLNVTIINPTDDEELALTLAGKKKKLNKSHFLLLAEGLGLTKKQIEGAFKRLKNNIPKAIAWLDNSFLSSEMKESYKEVLAIRSGRLEL